MIFSLVFYFHFLSVSLVKSEIEFDDGPIHDPMPPGDYIIQPEKKYTSLRSEKFEKEDFGCKKVDPEKDILGYQDLDFISTVKFNGYDISEVKVTTEDGYILTLFRIPGSPISPPAVGKTPALLWHGLMGNGWSWIFLPGNKSLAFQLADEGFDVFIGNNRGTQYSMGHTTKSPKNDDFWKWTFHELGYYDIPNSVDEILRITGHRSLYYIGHSLGTVMYSVAASLRPSFNSKIRTGFLLSPAPYSTSMTNQGLKALLTTASTTHDMKGSKLDPNVVSFPFGSPPCILDAVECNSACEYMTFLLMGYVFQSNPAVRKLFAKKYFDTTSLLVLKHLSQLHAADAFQQFDYEDNAKNMQKYGSIKPPLYPLGKISASTVIFWGLGDNVIPPADVKRTANKYNPKALKENNRVMEMKFSHLDFIVADDAKPLVNDRVVYLMKTGKYDRKEKIDTTFLGEFKGI